MSQDKPRFQRVRELTPRELAYAALGMFFVIALAITVVAIVESYSNQVDFALHHQMIAWHGRIAPVAVDAFIVLGELLLFAGILLKWRGFGLYLFATGLVLAGFALSVAANIWHAPVATVIDRAIQALWPVAATAALAGALLVSKRLVSAHAGQVTITDRNTADLQPWPAEPARAAEPPPSAPGPAAREPRRLRAARAPELAAARAGVERAMALELAHSPQPWPPGRQIAADERLAGSLSTRRRAADRIVAEARTMSNGGGHDDRDGA